jgi:HAD superfamily hydrolase (TIGR01509 family)
MSHDVSPVPVQAVPRRFAPAGTQTKVVFFDVGGPIYDDASYRRALLGALHELGAEVSDGDFGAEFELRRRAQAGITAPIVRRFLGPDVDPAVVTPLVERRWRYATEALFPDVLPVLETLRPAYRLGIIANQPAATRAALERDGVGSYVDVWALSAEVGLAKPDPRLFTYAVERAGCRPEEAVYVGDRLDNDIRPARTAGLRTLWLLRGEAPSEPTAAQLAEPDGVLRSLAELPAAIARLQRRPADLSARGATAATASPGIAERATRHDDET